MQQEDEFGNAVRERLPKIDQLLAEQNMSLSTRPLNAAIHFVEHWVLDIEGSTKEKYWDQDWFAILFWHVRAWYKDFYGDRLESPRQSLPGVVFINGSPFRLKIACTRLEVEDEGKTSWLVFLSDIDACDSLDAMFEMAPNLDLLNALARGAVESQVSRVVAATRALNLNLMTADLDGDALQMFRSSVLVHLESAINAATRNTQEGLSVGMWELHLMVEKSIKLVLKQKNAKCPNSHDLHELRALADAILDSTPLGDEFKRMMSKSQAISCRYCDAGPVSAQEFFELYIASILICAFYAERLRHKIPFKGFRVLLKKPHWLELPDA